MPSSTAPDASRDFPPEPRSARQVRAFVRSTLVDVPNLDDIVLAASELAANVIRHARTDFTVEIRLQSGGGIRLEVSDGSSVLPAVEDLTQSYRGLRMVESLSRDWGFEATDTGKTVWVEFSPPD
ncbi:MAG TPA: ATP-binding protein [Acidimicrobiia bacterium]|nr:ATP-binding protein [Acidimicrobiia bacterium]